MTALVPFVPRIYSRSELGMRSPKQKSTNFTPDRGGCALHYGGDGPNPAPSTFSAAKRIWLQWQDMHMDKNGWFDIGYSFGITNNGDIFTGRGIGVRPGSNGTDEGNLNYYGIVFIGGGSAGLSAKAEFAFKWLINHLRKLGAGMRVRPHKAFVKTSCPGPIISILCTQLHNTVINLPSVVTKPVPTVPVEEEFDMAELMVKNPLTGEMWPAETALWSMWKYAIDAQQAATQSLLIVKALAVKDNLTAEDLTEIADAVGTEFDERFKIVVTEKNPEPTS